MKPYIIENEELMKEWDWEKNNKLNMTPKTIIYGSNQKLFGGIKTVINGKHLFTAEQ